MSKPVFRCGQCRAEFAKWSGQCPQCGAWNSMGEARATPGATSRGARSSSGQAVASATLDIHDLHTLQPQPQSRRPSGLAELDLVLGGGLVSGSVVLLGGDPGIGKSTLLMQALGQSQGQAEGRPQGSATGRLLYVSAEESAAQIAMRAQRLNLSQLPLRLLTETRLEVIADAIEAERPDVCVVDSIQTIASDALASAPGSVGQVRECAAQLTRLAKGLGVTIILVGHVTKDGSLAGPKTLEHMVDTVIAFEGDPQSSYRLLRALKNRFGAVNELGVVAMTERGLRGVSNPSALFLSQHAQPVPGSCVTATLEGTRPLLVEVQALVDHNQGGNPRRLSVGLESSRLSMLLAVLHRHAGLATYDQDVFLNAVGGVRISEPSTDLAVCLAVASSLSGRALPAQSVVFGEVGLAGELRPSPRGQERLREAARLGFCRALIPRANQPKKAIEGIEVTAVERVTEAMQWLRG